MRKGLAALLVIIALVLSGLVSIAPAGATETIKCFGDRERVKVEAHGLQHTGFIWFDSCHNNHGQRWTKLKSAQFSYDRQGIIASAQYICPPVGQFKGVHYHLKFRNRNSNYVVDKTIKISCTSDTNAIKRISLVNTPRCYMPEVYSGGKLVRGLCHYNVSYENVWIGPNVKGHMGAGYFHIKDS